MTTEEKLFKLRADLQPYRSLLGQAADTVLEQDVSSYPIFVVHRQAVSIGLPVITRAVGGPEWSIHISTLEELATKRVIGMEKVDNFRQVYKNPEEFLCLFVLIEEGAQFVFIPR